MPYDTITTWAGPVTVAALVSILFQVLKKYLEKLPFARPGSFAHDDIMRAALWLINAGVIAYAMNAAGSLDWARVPDLLFNALMLMLASSGGYQWVQSKVSGGASSSASSSPAPADGATYSAYPPSYPDDAYALAPAQSATVDAPTTQPAPPAPPVTVQLDGATIAGALLPDMATPPEPAP